MAARDARPCTPARSSSGRIAPAPPPSSIPNSSREPWSRDTATTRRSAARIEWSDLQRAEDMLERTNALVPPDLAEERRVRLVMPT